MTKLLLPSQESSHNEFLAVTALLGTPLNVYDGHFDDGDSHLQVIVDTTNNPQVEDGELYNDKIHDVSVHETTVGENGLTLTRERIPSFDENRYPFTARVERTAFLLALAKTGMVQLDFLQPEGPSQVDS
jgi:hypothetical protein